MGKEQQENGRRNISAREVEIDLLEQLKQKQNEIRSIYFNLVRFYSEVGRQDVAQTYLQMLLDATGDPGEKAHYLLTMGQLMEQIRDYPSAITFYQKAFAMEPTDKGVWYLIHNNLGFSLNMLQRYAEGERFCREAIKIDPNRHNAYKNLAIALEGLGNPAEAVGNYLTATKLNPFDLRALNHLVELLLRKPELFENNPGLLKNLQDLSASSSQMAGILAPVLKNFT